MGRIEKHDGRAWRARAAECRAIADTFQNAETLAKMHLMADDYERMADRADQREQEAADRAKVQHGLAPSGRIATTP
jgi:hypothetical protein